MNLEAQLFIKGIKPSILLRDNEYIKCGIMNYKKEVIGDYYTTKFRGSTLVSHNAIPKIENEDLIILGKVLGYYPYACDKLFENCVEGYSEHIYFGGIKFNTLGMFDESLKWCRKEYLEKMLEEYNEVLYKKVVLIGGIKNQVIYNETVGVITKRV